MAHFYEEFVILISFRKKKIKSLHLLYQRIDDFFFLVIADKSECGACKKSFKYFKIIANNNVK